nr:reverse transcriptase domain-containing protein [Tanacetum cinerariifolium]
MQNQLANLTDMMSKFMSSNMASSSGLGTLPGNTFTNHKEDLKGITTRSGVAYKGPTTPTPSKVVKQGTEVTKDQVQTPNSQSTAHGQPPVTQSETLVSEPIAAPVSASMPNLKLSIPYPSRRDNERRREQANEQIEKFYKIFTDISFEISFTNALILMPKFASTLKALIGNKEKLSEMARTPMNEHCSMVILNKLPKKLGDPGKFLIPCEFPGMDECLALADLGASINLMPLSVWKELALPELTPTCMTLELADRSVSKPIGIAKDVSIKVAILNSDPAPSLLNHEKSVPSFTTELKACEAKTIKSSVDEPHEGINLEFCTHKILMEDDYKPAVQHQRRVNPKIHDVIKKEVEKLLDAGLIYPIFDSPWVSPVHCVPKKGGFTVVKNEENELIPTPIFHDMVEKTMEVFMDDFSIFGNSFKTFLSRLDKMLQRCEDTKLCLNWEKSHFMVKEGIVLGHKISRNGIEVDKAKVDVITKLPPPTTIKDVWSFLGHAGFYRRFIKDFSKISRPMTHLLKNDTPFIFSEDCIKAFQMLK